MENKERFEIALKGLEESVEIKYEFKRICEKIDCSNCIYGYECSLAFEEKEPINYYNVTNIEGLINFLKDKELPREKEEEKKVTKKKVFALPSSDSIEYLLDVSPDESKWAQRRELVAINTSTGLIEKASHDDNLRILGLSISDIGEWVLQQKCRVMAGKFLVMPLCDEYPLRRQDIGKNVYYNKTEYGETAVTKQEGSKLLLGIFRTFEKKREKQYAIIEMERRD